MVAARGLIALCLIFTGPSFADEFTKDCPGRNLCSLDTCRTSKDSKHDQLRDGIPNKLKWHSEILWREDATFKIPKRNYCYFRAVELFGAPDTVPFAWVVAGLKYRGTAEAGCVVVCSEYNDKDRPVDSPLEGEIKAGLRSQYIKTTRVWGPAEPLKIEEGYMVPHQQDILTSLLAVYAPKPSIVEVQSERVNDATIRYTVRNRTDQDIAIFWNFRKNASVRETYPATRSDPVMVEAGSAFEVKTFVRSSKNPKSFVAVEDATVEIKLDGKPWITAKIPTYSASDGDPDMEDAPLWVLEDSPQ